MDGGQQDQSAQSREFAKPSDLFRWCLRHATHDVHGINYRTCFAEYVGAAQADGYLWRQYDRRLESLIAAVRPGLKVLEVGCGLGHDLCWTALRGATSVGIDIKSEMTGFAEQLLALVRREIDATIAVDIRHTNLMAMDPAEQFDFIYMKDTLHHLEPRAEVIDKLASLLAPGGHILIVEPNAWNPLIQFQMFRIRGFKTVIRKTDVATGEEFVYGNERLLTGGTMIRLFRHAGISGSTRSFRLLPTRLSGRSGLARVASRIEARRLERLVPLLPVHTVFFGRKDRLAGAGQ
ncbi:MAG: class I SAM-dependent methyltransferase [Rhodospirillaceae bacterium]|nr:class I SAM-dependent methyltransferase [Rhodospirillaceae bacterium]